MADMNEKIAQIERDVRSLEFDLLKIRREDISFKSERKKSSNIEGDDEADNEELSVTEKIINDLADFSREPSYEDARLYLEKARDMKMDPAIFRGAYRLFLLGALTKKCPKCWYGVGLCIYNGYGMEADEDLGAQILEDHFDDVEALAKKNTDTEAMIIVYECYENGYGVYPNKQKAQEWLGKAVKAKNPRALYLRAGCEDELNPVELLTECFNKGFHLSYYALSLLHYHGYYLHTSKYSSSKKRQGVTVDYEKATRYNRQGAGMGDGRCIRRQAELRELKKGFKIFEGKLTDYTGSSTGTITIPKCVTEIDAYALSACSSTSEIILPESITYIDSRAFGSYRKKGYPKLRSTNNTYDVNAYFRRLNEDEKQRKRQSMKEYLFEDNPHKTFSVTALVLLFAFLVVNTFISVVPAITFAPILYTLIFGGCCVGVLVGYILAMVKERSGWQIIVGSVFVGLLMFLAFGAGILPEKFVIFTVIGSAIVTFFGVVITYFDDPADILGKTLTFVIITVVLAAPFVLFELVLGYSSSADTLVKAMCLLGAITMGIASVRYTHWRGNWRAHRILFLVFYAILMTAAYTVGELFAFASIIAVLLSVAAMVYGYIILNDSKDKPILHGIFKLVSVVVVTLFFGIFEGFSLPSVIPMLIFLACAIAMVVAMIIAYKRYTSELQEIICVPFFGAFVLLALFGGSMSTSFIIVATVASIVASVLAIMISAEIEFDDTAFKVVAIIGAVLVVAALIFAFVSPNLDFGGENDLPSTEDTGTNSTVDNPSYPDYDPDYYPDNYYPGYNTNESGINLQVGFNPVMLILAILCLIFGIRAKKEYMEQWHIVVCFIFAGVFAFMTLFSGSLLANAAPAVGTIVLIASVLMTVFAFILSKVDYVSDIFDDHPKLVAVGLPVAAAAVVLIGLISGSFYICLPNIIMVGIYGFLAFGAFGLLIEATESYEGPESALSAVAMTVLALSVLFGGMYPIWLHIGICIGAVAVFGFAAD